MLDFKHGTGHGISAALSVHEGPHRISTFPNNVPIVPGMLMSNEPGFYKNGEYGIRLENIILCKKYGSSEYGNFLCFETVSFAPFDLAAIDKSLLTEDEITWLNNYHIDVYEKLSPYLNEDEKLWLKEATMCI
jgi:Xaa-Pro aminopeptidase